MSRIIVNSSKLFLQQSVAMALFVTEEFKDELFRLEHEEKGYNLIKNELMFANTNESVIIISDVLQEVVTGSELAAIIAHEQGHINYQHVERSRMENTPKVDGFILSEICEMEADSYACREVSAQAMYSGLTKVMKYMAAVEAVKLNASKEQVEALYFKSSKNRLDHIKRLF